MIEAFQTSLIGLAIILGAMTLLWAMSVWLRDVSIVDAFWGLGFVILAWLTFVLASESSRHFLVLCGLATIWGLRLSIYLLWRNVGRGEDYRYAAMRQSFGTHFWWSSLGFVFLLQGIILWIVALPIIASAYYPDQPWNPLHLGGILLWCIGMLFEVIGDWQLARFKANPANRGRVLQNGLWRFTRHPNYFGDFCVWWGVYLIAAGSGAWWTFFRPFLMSLSLMRVSGVTLLESTIQDRRPDYIAYRRSTNAFFPWFPRR
jgi:steroid 5-alpha reductase family enzyme